MSEHDSEEPLLKDVERDTDSPVSSVKFGRRRLWRLGLHPGRRYLGSVLIAVVFFVLGLVVHTPESMQSFRGRQSISTELGALSAAHDARRAIRVRVLKNLLQERYPPGHGSTWVRRLNFEVLERLGACLEQGTCAPNQDTVILLASFRFAGAEGGGNSGEEIWAASSLRAFRALNYTLIFTHGHMDTLMVYQHLPDMIPVVLWDQAQLKRCEIRDDSNYEELENLDQESPGKWQTGKKACMQSEDYPEGVPWWKSFMFVFWAQHGHPLGGQWAVAPEDYSFIRQNGEEHNYLGYSIEHRCLKTPTFKAREHRALILAKNDDYFDDDHNVFHKLLGEVRDKVRPAHVDGREIKFDLISTSGDELASGEKKDTLEPGIQTIGRQQQDDWVEILAKSKVLLGIGRPQLSPSPYDALCLGVPFINPILAWDQQDPTNRVRWETQQDALKYTDEPFVYHVFAKDAQGLADALQRAVENPIDRYIPDKMHSENVLARHRRLVETDWHAAAKQWVNKNYREEAEKWKHLTLDMPSSHRNGYP